MAEKDTIHEEGCRAQGETAKAPGGKGHDTWKATAQPLWNAPQPHRKNGTATNESRNGPKRIAKQPETQHKTARFRTRNGLNYNSLQVNKIQAPANNIRHCGIRQENKAQATSVTTVKSNDTNAQKRMTDNLCRKPTPTIKKYDYLCLCATSHAHHDIPCHKRMHTANQYGSMRGHHGTGSYTLLYIDTACDSERRGTQPSRQVRKET